VNPVLTVGVRELRNKLSQYLKRVEQGERIQVTDRGEVIALLIPAPNGSDVKKAALNMVEKGIASWSGGKPRGAVPPVKNTGRPLSDIVIEDRR
jgi:prevent-host-death family protein